MIFAYTDFQHQGPYRGELEAACRRHCTSEFVHLMHDAPRFNPAASGRLLAALSRRFQAGDVCIAIVDPGVGGPRRPAALCAHGVWYVGPDNGLLAEVARQDRKADWWEITWMPESLSSSFHGRDLFAPFAGQLDAGHRPTAIGARPLYDPVMPDPAPEQVIYQDDFGNCITSIAAEDLNEDQQLIVNGRTLPYAFTFSSVAAGEGFWYVNSMGLAEIAINQASAAAALQIQPGDPVAIQTG